MNAEQKTGLHRNTTNTINTCGNQHATKTGGKAAAGLRRTGRHTGGGKTSKVTLVEATLDHSPGQIDLDGPALAQALSYPVAPPHFRLIAGWLANFSSTHTRTAYYGDLISFATYANDHSINIIEATKSDVAGFKAVLEDTDGDNHSPATVARRISAVSSFFRHLEEEGHSIGNPALLVRRPKVSTESMTPALTRTEAARLLEHAETAGPRDHALVCLLLLNGLRISEICSANIGDLHTVEHHQVLKIKRKGGLVAQTVLAPRTHGAIRTHIDTRTNADGKTARGPLIIDNTGQRIDRFQALRIVGRLTKTAGIDKPITPHGLRHTFVTTERAANIDVRDVQAAVGHADPRTTMRYDQTKQRLDAHPTLHRKHTHRLSGDTMNLVSTLWPFLALLFVTSILLVGMVLYPLTGTTAFEYRIVEATDAKLRVIDPDYPVTSIVTKALGFVADTFSGAGRRVFHPLELPRTSDRDWKTAIAKQREQLENSDSRYETRRIACQVARLDQGDYSTTISAAIETEASRYSDDLIERINQSEDFDSLRYSHKGAWTRKLRLMYSCSRLPQVREVVTTHVKDLIDSISRGATVGILPAIFIGDRARTFNLDTVVTNAGRWGLIGAVIGAIFFSGRVLKGAADVMCISRPSRYVHFIQRHPKTTAVLLVAFAIGATFGAEGLGKLLAK